MVPKKNVLIKILVEMSRAILGITFIFSGFAKSVDPYGTAYKIEDYLSAFSLDSLLFLSFPASFFLCGFEFLLGACMLFGLYRKWNSRLVLLVMCFMTPLTLYLAIADPVQDCGCFGEAWIITNWQTFYKNIVLLVMAVFAFVHHERISNIFTGKTYWLAFLYIIVFVGGFIARNYYYDPLFNFRPYKVGANISQLMTVDDEKKGIEEMVLIYEKDGVEKEFTEDNYPWEDSTWNFVRREINVVKRGEEPAIKDFSLNRIFIDKDGMDILDTEDITWELLADTGYVFLMTSSSLDNMPENHLGDFEDVANYAEDNGYSFYCLTASATEDVLAWEKRQVTNFNYCLMDERVLKTIIRFNPGLMLLKNGTIINKWTATNMPNAEGLNKPLNRLEYSKIVDEKEKDKKNLAYISLTFLLPLLGLKVFDLVFFRKKDAED